MKRQKYGGARTSVIIVRCTGELKAAIKASADARGITVGRLVVERLSAEPGEPTNARKR